ncbi:PREDICTED: uncharacterized protein LOC108558317 [Nicrophorus vespilloides]|uniref:Fatty acyl-CoA reductase n=1 Tax=Nicrophorus vespilloides TaxID=110193 RepID=A0ABM1M7Y6_NICVS|nr:PREDICTED: uncharacterized protein LOC108558317 [Nicrophorus vespilloides]
MVDTSMSELQQFYAGKTIFLTGASGFLGKILLEKLLRTCPDVKKIYILVRTKKGKDPKTRFDDIFSGVVFQALNEANPEYKEKVSLITGDCALPDLGIQDADKETITKEVNIILHSAATVRFDEHLTIATNINVRAIRDLIAMAKKMPQLKSFIHISTVYSNCIRKEIDENFYEASMKGNNLIDLIECLDENLISDITSQLIGEYPNSYVFTKALAEDVIKSEGVGLPLAIVRPSIVVASCEEPVKGWIDNVYGPTGVTIGVALGIIRTMHCRKDNVVDIVPADYVCNAILAACWATDRQHQSTSEDEREKLSIEKRIPIYNFVSSAQNAITWNNFINYAYEACHKVPSPLVVWHYVLFLTSNVYLYELAHLLLHTVPGHIVDFIARCIGKKPLLVKGYKKIHKFMLVVSYFAQRQWDFHDDNTKLLWKSLCEKDRQLFQFNIATLDWISYFDNYTSGCRLYLLKDTLDTVPAGRRKLRILKYAHYTLMGFLLYGLYLALRFVLSTLPIEMEESSEICAFFEDKTVFLTGSTGFLGKILIEKLLRVCNVGKIFMLVRCKKGKSEEERFKEIFEIPLFDRLKIEKPKFLEKLVMVAGDCSLPNLGIKDEDRKMIIDEVHVIFHCAATVRFDQKLRTATNINVIATKDICAMAREMINLKSLLYISTAYSFCTRTDIDEQFYKPQISAEKLFKLLDVLNDDQIAECQESILGKWPNTYSFSKSISEEVFKDESKGLPTAMIRPSIIISTFKEPIAGWVDNYYGPMGVAHGAGLGLLRTLHADPLKNADLVPADYVINAMLAVAWKSSKQIFNEPKIYNYVSSPEKPINWKTYMAQCQLNGNQIPSPLAVWYFIFRLNKYKWKHNLDILLLHTLPAYIIDFLAFCIGKKPILVESYKKIHKFINVLSYFTNREWNFENENTKQLWLELNKTDKKTFEFSMAKLDWNAYYKTYMMGGRIYLLKDPMETVPAGKRKLMIMQSAHYCLVALIWFLLYKLIVLLYGAVF